MSYLKKHKNNNKKTPDLNMQGISAQHSVYLAKSFFCQGIKGRLHGLRCMFLPGPQ